MDPRNLTKFDRTDAELEELIVFCVCVAGKNAMSTAKAVEKLRVELAGGILETRDKQGRLVCVINCGDDPKFQFMSEIRCYTGTWGLEAFANLLSKCGIGCQNDKAYYLQELAYNVRDKEMNLRTCTTEDLIAIPGIGRKTANLFILHSRPNQEIVSLDTHILAELRERGFNAPRSTPGKHSLAYTYWANIVYQIIKQEGIEFAVWDLAIWNKRSKKNE